MNKLKELLDSLGNTKHLLNEYCYGTGACGKCPLYNPPLYDPELEKYGRVETCCSQVTTVIEELECRIVDIMNKEKKNVI